MNSNENSDESSDSMSERTTVGGKPELAYGHFRLVFNISDKLDEEIHVSKVFGLVKKDNSVLKVNYYIDYG